MVKTSGRRLVAIAQVLLTSLRGRAGAVADVVPAATGADIVVRGRPKGSLLTTKWGEGIHARKVQKDLRTAVRNALVA